VIAVVRDGHTEINPAPEHTLNAEDVLVLLGSPVQIESAVEQINSARI
jgi:K+/H+ antiporter YhaU regulatory subunit KhtT